jgi:hypothetical protein
MATLSIEMIREIQDLAKCYEEAEKKRYERIKASTASSFVEAKEKNLDKYFTGKPCKRGHLDYRSTKGRNCLTCQAERNKINKERYRTDPEWRKNTAAKQRKWMEGNWELYLWHGAKKRAKRDNLLFTIVPEDIVIPSRCPVLGFELRMNKGSPSFDSAAIDRLYPSLGYTKKNIIVVSHRANAIKNDSTIIELEKTYLFYKELLNK